MNFYGGIEVGTGKMFNFSLGTLEGRQRELALDKRLTMNEELLDGESWNHKVIQLQYL